MDAPRDPALGSLMVIVTGVMHAISIPLVGGRIYDRVVPSWRLSWDGYFLIAAVVFDFIQWVFLLLSIGYGYGHDHRYVPASQFLPLAKFLFLSQPFSVWALSCAKISVACCLLRIQRGSTRPPSWRMFLYCLIGVQAIICAVITYFQFTGCRPLRANWGERVPGAECVDVGTARTSIFVSLSMVAFTDLTFALLPLPLLRYKPPVHEKVAIYSIVFVGFLAMCATIARTTFVDNFVYGKEILVSGVGLTICTNLETQLAIMAASVACLKRPLEKLLRKLGVIDSKLRHDEEEELRQVTRAGGVESAGADTLNDGP
ncbi:hypothetical protein MFIFM68171_10231 [Madurella fahalii]|uniref:Rhodopsin domain-containing protein n=1 Tax=Madurella fahalii TaxID=1157608 RepID=A0ABQ0GQL5_9PEZI